MWDGGWGSAAVGDDDESVITTCGVGIVDDALEVGAASSVHLVGAIYGKQGWLQEKPSLGDTLENIFLIPHLLQHETVLPQLAFYPRKVA